MTAFSVLLKSKMMKVTLERAEEEVVESTVVHRIGRPEDMAGAALYLASKASGFVTGILLVVDGGILIRPKM